MIPGELVGIEVQYLREFYLEPFPPEHYIKLSHLHRWARQRSKGYVPI